MKKRNIIISVLLAVLFATASFNSANAQVFIMEDDDYNYRDPEPGGFVIHDITPEHDTTWDYTPIGDGLWLLGGLAGAYLLGKRRKKDSD